MDPYCDRSTTVENLFFGVGRSMNDRKNFFSFLFGGVRDWVNLEIIGRDCREKLFYI